MGLGIILLDLIYKRQSAHVFVTHVVSTNHHLSNHDEVEGHVFKPMDTILRQTFDSSVVSTYTCELITLDNHYTHYIHYIRKQQSRRHTRGCSAGGVTMVHG